jgi:type II secretory pathway pseudopilin PulG
VRTPDTTSSRRTHRIASHPRTSILRGTEGFALITALLVMLIVGLLTAAAVDVATQTSTSTTQDNNVKAALEAAEAGLQVATYRISAIKPSETQCIAGGTIETPPSGTYCAASPIEPLGNRASFRYWTSLPLAASSKCAGGTVELKSGYTQRCITAEGKVGSVSQRLATRLQSSLAEPLFTVAGVLGLTEVRVSGSVHIPGLVASNEKIIGEGSAAFAGGYELCPPKGSFTPSAGAERNASGVTVGGVGGMLSNPPYEKTRSVSACPFKAALTKTHATAASNEDSRFATLEGKNNVWNPGTYELTLESTPALSLSGTAKYYLCNFLAARESFLEIKPGAKIEIFIDSPEDPGSPCKAGSGKFEVGGNFKLLNAAKAPSVLLIQMYGKGPFFEGNGGAFEGDIYAPAGEVKINGGTTFKGGILSNIVRLEAGAGIFEWTGSSTITSGSAGRFVRSAWEQCATGSGASEGC